MQNWSADVQRRIEMTTQCRDSDLLPRVPLAGSIIEKDGAEVQVMHNGILIEKDCYDGAWMTELISRMRGIHEPQEEFVFDAVMKRLATTSEEVPVMLEIGSYWAYYSLWFLHELPHGRTICVEPFPKNLEVGRRNFALNDRQGRFIHAGFSEDGEKTFKFHVNDSTEVMAVPGISLQSIMNSENVKRFDVVLADIQGAETALLKNSMLTLSQGKVRFLFISTHDIRVTGTAVTHQNALALIRECGGHIVAEHSVAESYSGDGLIVASFDSRDVDMQVPISYARSKDSLFGEWELRYDELDRKVWLYQKLRRTRIWHAMALVKKFIRGIME